MEVLENTENDRQIDHQTIDCYVITLTSEIQKLRTQYVTNPLNMGMFVIFPWLEINGQRFITGLQDHQTQLLKLLGRFYEAVYS